MGTPSVVAVCVGECFPNHILVFFCHVCFSQNSRIRDVVFDHPGCEVVIASPTGECPSHVVHQEYGNRTPRIGKRRCGCQIVGMHKHGRNQSLSQGLVHLPMGRRNVSTASAATDGMCSMRRVRHMPRFTAPRHAATSTSASPRSKTRRPDWLGGGGYEECWCCSCGRLLWFWYP